VDEALTTANSASLFESEVASLGVPAPTGDLTSSGPDSTHSWIPFNVDPPQGAGTVLPDESFFLDDSLFSFGDTLTPSFGP
jgi:hypothetical protein